MVVASSARAALEAVPRGATVVQLRDPGAGGRRREEEAGLLVRESPVPVLVSARVDVALATGAAGVNLPEQDLPVSEARRLLGAEHLLGRSVHSVAAAREAEAEGADFVIFGPVFDTPSHPGQRGRGLAALGEVAAAVRIPVLAIGGLDPARGRECRQAGAAGWAAISAFAR
jgi:thiamine-phosphate diphosphorylase